MKEICRCNKKIIVDNLKEQKKTYGGWEDIIYSLFHQPLKFAISPVIGADIRLLSTIIVTIYAKQVREK